MATDAEILAAIDTAIIDILQNGQEVSFKNTNYSKANISILFDLREKYSQKISTSDTFLSRSKTIIPGRG